MLSSQGARRIGRYLLCDQIGSGGMATIHVARLLGPKGFSRTVAIKQLHPQFAQNPQFVAMFLDEARMAVRVRHGNVLSPIDVVATESELFIVMDYVSGESLGSLLAASEGPLRPTIAAAILVQVLLGLQAAHEATREQGEALGLVHRDVSPQNILVGQDGVARVLDFGIAKAVARSQTTDGGILKGKLGYMAPEQLRLEVIDRRTDLFTAGVVLWETLTGTELFEADALATSLELILHGKIAPPSSLNPAVSPELDAVTMKALARDRNERFQDAMSMAEALQRATPLASALEVIQWVEKLAGPELARKAELVRRAEGLTSETIHLLGPGIETEAEAGEPSLILERLSAPDVVPPSQRSHEVHDHAGRVTLEWPTRFPRSTPLFPGVALPRQSTALPTQLTPATVLNTLAGSRFSPGELTDVALGASTDTSVTPRTEHTKWKPLGIAFGVALVGALGALGLSLSGQPSALGSSPLSGSESSAAVNPAPTPSGASSPGLARSVAAPNTAATDVHDEPLAAGVPSSTVSTLPLAESSGAVSLASRVRASRSRSSTAGVARRGSAKASAASSALDRSAVKAHGKATAQSAVDPCQPPWTIDDQQIKMFKPECLR